MSTQAIIRASVAEFKAAQGDTSTPDADSGDVGPEPVEVSDETPPVEEPDEPVEPVEPAAPQVVPPAGDEPPPPPVTEPVVTPPVVEPLAETSDDSELGPRFDKKGRENKIPQPRVEKMLEKRVAKVNAEWEGKVKEHTAKITDYESRLEKISEVERIMFEDPKRFVSMLKSIPGYETELTAPAAAPAADPTADMPQPDVDLGDGRTTYSVKGLNELMKWQAGQTEQQIAKRYKPLEEAFQSQKRHEAMMPAIRAEMEDAKTWEGFTENYDAILDVLRKDTKQTISLEKAYRMVVFPKLKANRDADKATMRAEIIAEMKKAAPVSNSVAAPAAIKITPPAQTGPRSLSDIIRESIHKKA